MLLVLIDIKNIILYILIHQNNVYVAKDFMNKIII